MSDTTKPAVREGIPNSDAFDLVLEELLQMRHTNGEPSPKEDSVGDSNRARYNRVLKQLMNQREAVIRSEERQNKDEELRMEREENIRLTARLELRAAQEQNIRLEE